VIAHRTRRWCVGLVAAVALVVPFVAAPPAGAAADPPGTTDDPTVSVNPLIGTANGGNVFPGAVLPFGMFSFSPENTRGSQTRTAAPGGYLYSATKIHGFSLTHLSGTGCAGASGDVPFFPYVGEVTTSPSADSTDAVYASTFSHANEVARPGFYSVKLDSGATADLTSTMRTGSGRFTFPAGKPATMLVRSSNSELVSTAANVSVDPATRSITGDVTSGNFCGYIGTEDRRSYYTLHYYAQFDQPFTSTGTWTDATVTPGSTSASGGTQFGTDGFPVPGKGSGAFLRFPDGATVNVRVGISYVSWENAVDNLRRENPAGTAFDTVQIRAHDAWRDELGHIQVGGGTADQRTIFYTALYHALLHPNVVSDVNRDYWGMDQQRHVLKGKQRAQYGNFSGWDIYRSQSQLATLVDPKAGSDIAQSLFNQANQFDGTWDRWTHLSGATHVMAGDPSVPTLAGIHAFGGTDFDLRGAFKSLRTAATVPTDLDLSARGKPVESVGQRPSLDKFLKLHYVPAQSNAWGGAGETLEDATADFALGQLAADLGDTRAAQQFTARSQYWQNVFNPESAPSGGYIQNRNEDGSWPSSSPDSFDGFAEGTSAQYTWMVQHNIAGLFQALGGTEKAVQRLDMFFHNPDGSFAITGGDGTTAEMDNEPSINVAWLYDYAGQPYKTQQTVRQVVNMLWSTRPEGIPGNDDLGEMSSWFVFAALGMYPQVPSRAELVLGSPLFPFARVQRAGGKDIVVRAPEAAADTPFVQSLRVNGQESTKPWITDAWVNDGVTLDYTLGTTPNTTWGSAAADAPPSWRQGELPYAVTSSPNKMVVPQGTGGQVTVKAFRLGATTPGVQFRVSPPAGLTASPARGTVTVDPTTGVGSATFTVNVAAGTPDGRYAVPITFTTTDRAQLPRLAVTVVVGQPGSFTVLRNNTGISDDTGTHEEADFDTGGVSFSKQALTAAGLVPGKPSTVDGLTFTWPELPAGEPDNIGADGSQLNVDVPATATKLAFVGSASNGDQLATATLVYADGTTQAVDVGFSDWTLGGGGGQLMFGNVIVAKTPYRNLAGGTNEMVDTYMFMTAPIGLAPGKRLTAVRLPDNRDLHVFAVAAG
jgi:predicted alpha-1,2-mannosidase